MSGLDSYTSGPKETWRGWQWNRVIERLGGVRPKMSDKEIRIALSDKVVLYLCGPDNIDGREAVKRGFSKANLFAVDICEDNIRRVRSEGGIGLVGRLEQIIINWKENLPIDVIIADTCSGFNEAVLDLTDAVVGSAATNQQTVLSINMKRGRDAGTNYIREFAKTGSVSDLDTSDVKARLRLPASRFRTAKQRRYPKVLADSIEWLEREHMEWCGTAEAVNACARETLHRAKQWWWEMFKHDIMRAWNSSQPAFYTYKNKTNGVTTSVMDSVVCRAARLKDRDVRGDWLAASNKAYKGNVKGVIAAAKAIRTSRNGHI